MLRGTLIVLVLGRQVGPEFFVDTRKKPSVVQQDRSTTDAPACREKREQREEKKKEVELERKREFESQKESLDDPEALPERVDEIPIVCISMYIKDVHTENASFLNPCSLETETLWIIEGDDLFGELRPEVRGGRTKIPMPSEPSGTLERSSGKDFKRRRG